MIIKYPLSNEKAIKQIEIQNVIMFIVDKRANKKQIQEELEKEFKVQVEKVNTHIRDNKKIAVVKLKKNFKAIDIATKLGMM